MGINNNDELNNEPDKLNSSRADFNAGTVTDENLSRLAELFANDPSPIWMALIQDRILNKFRFKLMLHRSMFYLIPAGVVLSVLVVGTVLVMSSNNTPRNDSELVLTDSSGGIVQDENKSLTQDISTPEIDNNSVIDTSETTPELTEEPELTQNLVPTIETKSEITLSSPSAQSETTGHLYVKPGGPANVRSGPSTSYAVIATLTPNTELLVVGTNASGDWIQVIMPDGNRGWIASFLVTEQKGSGTDSDTTGGNGRDASVDCGHGNSCNAPGQTKDNQGNANGRAGG